VRRLAVGIAQHLERRLELVQRRDGEAHATEVDRPEAIPEHLSMMASPLVGSGLDRIVLPTGAPTATLGSMRDVFRTPGALTLFALSCVARLPMGAVGLLLVLHTQQLTGSYADGGVASGAYALALGLSNPALARQVDRRGQAIVLRLGAPIAASAMLGLALLPEGASLGEIAGFAILAGLSQPPVGACMRALWPELIQEPDRRHAAYALEGAALELVYICGPVAIVAGIGSWSMSGALAACAAFVLIGDLAFSAHRVSRGWQPHPERVRSLTGALRGPGVRVLVVVFALCGLCIGSVEVALPAALDDMGHRDLTGLLLGLWGVGSMLAGLAVVHLGPAKDPTRRLSVMLVAWGVAHASLALAGAPATVALVLLIAGATIAPTFVSANGMLDDLAPPGTLTEAFTWTSTGIAVGAAAGSALAGAITESASAALAMALLGAGGIVAAVVVRAAAGGPLSAARRAGIHAEPELYSAPAGGCTAPAVPPAPVAELVDAQG
jgi:MFS family permease